MNRWIIITLLLSSLLSGAQNVSRETAYDFNKKLGRGINFMATKINGNYHDPFDFNLIKENKFTHVRIGSRVWQYVGGAPDFTIEAGKLSGYRNAVDWALDHDLMVVMDPIHAWEEYSDADLPMLLKLWEQIASAFEGYPLDRVAFEIFNEPRSYDFDLEAMVKGCINVIRSFPGNEERIIIVSGQSFSTRQALIDALNNNVVFPIDDPFLVGTFHYYDPRPYTNQGLEGNVNWADQGDGDPEWDETIVKFQEVVDANDNWAAVNDTPPLPIYLGEFGVDNSSPEDDRIRWLWWIRIVAEQMGFSNSIWNLYNNSPDSKGMGPWTDLQKEDPTTRYLDQNFLDPYRNRYEGEKGSLSGAFGAGPWPGSSDGLVASSFDGAPGDRIHLQEVYIGRSGVYDATFRYQNNSMQELIVCIASGTQAQLIDSVKLKLLPSEGEWMSATIPLEFLTGNNNRVLVRLDSPASSFQFDYLAITKGIYFDNLYPATVSEIVIASIKSPYSTSLRVYPVPASDTLIIDGNFDTWVLSDLSGKVIKTGSDTHIPVNELCSGMYILSVDEIMHKIIVE